MTPVMRQLRAHLGEINDLSSAAALLGWDQQTNMPPGGAAQRARQSATLRRLVHAKFTSNEMGELIVAAERDSDALPEDHDDHCLARLARRDYDRARKLPTEFVAEWTRDAVLSNQVWQAARPANDFATFQPHLQKMVEYARRAAEYYGYRDHPYDALLDGFEPGLTTAETRRIFAVLRPAQSALADEIARKPVPRVDFLRRDYPEAQQKALGLKVAIDFGYDLRRGRLDVAPHPFATGFGRDDVRITTRYARDFLPQALFAILHETGHALYEQNVSPELDRTPLARGCSNVFHESQSRLWENLVGRSRQFSQYYFPALQREFADQLGDVSADEFYAAVNCVHPSLIRVEADEVTYNLHIILRFELEVALIAGEMEAADLPDAWMARMEEYLAIRPPDDRDGVMQDTHWSTGSFGYFPTYALGNVMGAQVFATHRRTNPEIDRQIACGDFQPLLAWLTENVYQHGKKYLPRELAVRVNGAPLDPRPYLDYLHRKFGDLYGLNPAAS
jgi:carboxypeptidase Taq